jgi:DNA adenine methylase
MMSVDRPVMRYHGGKWKLAPWIIAQMPPHDVYVEPFGGGANVLLRKERGAAECYNDLDGTVVNVFRVLQDPKKAERLRRQLELTPYARAEFDRCYEPAVDDVDQACRTITLSFLGYGSDSITRGTKTGFRGKLSDKRAFPSQAWASYPQAIFDFVDRLRGVLIEQRDAREVIQRLDSTKTLFFVDPPYVMSTRSSMEGRKIASHGYRHEMTDADHCALAETLHGVSGMVMLSGYRSDLYDGLYAGWDCVERAVWADHAKPRTECLWLNPAAECYSSRQRTFLHLEQALPA